MPNGTPKIDQVLMRRLWIDGIRTGVIADYFGCASPAVSRLAKVLGLPKRNNRGVLYDAPKPPPAPPRHGRNVYLSKPDTDPEPQRPKQRHTYANVQELVANGMNQRQALQAFHRMRA